MVDNTDKMHNIRLIRKPMYNRNEVSVYLMKASINYDITEIIMDYLDEIYVQVDKIDISVNECRTIDNLIHKGLTSCCYISLSANITYNEVIIHLYRLFFSSGEVNNDDGIAIVKSEAFSIILDKYFHEVCLQDPSMRIVSRYNNKMSTFIKSVSDLAVAYNDDTLRRSVRNMWNLVR